MTSAASPRIARNSACVVALCGAYGIYCLVTRPPGPVTAPDTLGYLTFAPIRSLGYPVFLKLVGQRGAMMLQPIFFAAALASLGIETLRLTSSLLVSAAVVIAPMLIPELKTYHYSVLTESLFASLMMAFLSCVLGFVAAPSRPRIAGAAALASVAAVVRSAGLAFLLVLPVMILIYWHRTAGARLVMLVAVVAPAVLILGGERAAALAIHGDKLTTIMGRHSFSKAALIDAPATPVPSEDPQRAHFDEELDVYYASMRQFLSSAPPSVRPVLTLFYEVCLQGPCVPELGTTEPGDTPKAVNHLLEQAGMARLARAPLGYVALTAGEYRSLWTAFRLRHPHTVSSVNAFVAAHRPLPFEGLVFRVGPRDVLEFQPSSPVRFIQPLVVALGWLTGVLALVALVAAAARRELPPVLMAASLVSLTVHGGLLFTAVFAAGIGRFMLAFWPAVTTAAILGAWWMVSLVRDVEQPA
jgi:hypothetical protein